MASLALHNHISRGGTTPAFTTLSTFDEFCTFHGCHVIIRELNLKSSYNRILFGRLLDYLRAYNPLLLTVSR